MATLGFREGRCGSLVGCLPSVLQEVPASYIRWMEGDEASGDLLDTDAGLGQSQTFTKCPEAVR